jgi:phosphoserine phosphatase RsbU/P
LQFSNFKLTALLELTNAINANLSTTELLDKYKSLLLEELNIGKLIVYAFYDKWVVMLESGGKLEDYEHILVESDLIDFTEITSTSSTENKKVSSYDFIIPVFHNQIPLAYVLIGDVDEEQEGVSPTIKHLSFIQTLTNVIFVAVENKRLYKENLKQERIKQEMKMAAEMQNMLVPNAGLYPPNKHLTIHSFYLPHFEVGGDYYDFMELSDSEFFFCIADVSGKGMPAAMLMSNFQASLKAFLKYKPNLPDLMANLNERVLDSAKGEKFITFFAGIYNYDNRKLKYINAGHNPPFLYEKKTGKLQQLIQGCVGMGMLDFLPNVEQGVINVPYDSKLVLFTDGLAELDFRNQNNPEGGLEALEMCLSDRLSLSSNIEKLIKELNIEKSNPALFDDITILGIEFF